VQSLRARTVSPSSPKAANPTVRRNGDAARPGQVRKPFPAARSATGSPTTPHLPGSVKIEHVRPDKEEVWEEKPRLELTQSLAKRLLADLLCAYCNSSVDAARESVGINWGFENPAEMATCIEAQANVCFQRRLRELSPSASAVHYSV